LKPVAAQDANECFYQRAGCAVVVGQQPTVRMVLPLAIGIGFGSVVLFVYAHLLLTYLPGY
jgi:hypothetical protein